MAMVAKVQMDGGPLLTQSQRVEAVEAAVRAICEGAGTGPDDGIAVLLQAAVCIAMSRSPMSKSQVTMAMVEALLVAFESVECVEGEAKPDGATAH